MRIRLLRLDRHAARCLNRVLVTTRMAVLGARSAPRNTGNQSRALPGYRGWSPWLVFCLAVAGAGSPADAQTELVIDDFTGSPYSKSLWNQPTWLTEYQSGPNIVGGVRQTSFVVTPAEPSLPQPTRLQILPQGPLVVSGGYKSYFGLYLGYGYDATGGANPLELDLSEHGRDCPGCDRFRIDLDGSDSELSYLMQVYDSSGRIATLFGTESTAGRILPFHLDFPFADFVQSSDSPVDWNHIDFVFVYFQTGNFLGGHDFAVTRISAIPTP